MKQRFIFVLGLGMLSAACTPPVLPTAPTSASEQATIKLTESATAISRSLAELDQIQAAATPPARGQHLLDPRSFGMETYAFVDWYGPIGPLVQKIAKATHFRLRVLGTAPAIPVLVSVVAKDANLGDVLRNIDFQAGRKANIVVYAKKRIIELRYAKP